MKTYLSITIFFYSFIFSTSITAQSVTSGPGRTGNYTVTGFYSSSPPVIDGILDDGVWNTSATPTIVDGYQTGGAGYNGTKFPALTDIKEIINLRDNGILSGSPPTSNVTTPYPTSAGSFGTAWDTNYFYFAVRIIDANIPISNVVSITNKEINLYLNNGNGRSFQAGPSVFPSLLASSGRDVQIALGFIPTVVGVTAFPKVGDPGISIRQGFSLPEGTYRFAVQRTADGFIYEGRIAWSRINKEFFNEANGAWLNEAVDKAVWSPSKTRPALGFDVEYNFVRQDDVSQGFSGTPPRKAMMWNQCCYNINWSMSNFYGVVALGGDIRPVVCPASIAISLNPTTINSPNGTSTASVSILPILATKDIIYSVVGTVGGINGIHNLARIDANTGIVLPINNGTATIIARSSNPECKLNAKLSTVVGVANLNISGQNAVTGFNVTGADITTNWGISQLSAVPNPNNAPNFLVWSLKPTNLATINSITGMLRATALGSGVVTITAKSLANGVETHKLINITTPNLVSCIIINANTNIDQCDRTENSANVRTLFSGSQVTLLGQYSDPVNNIPGEVPAEFMKYTVLTSIGIPTSSFPLTRSGSDWILTFNNLSGRITILGAYFNTINKDTIKSHLILTVRAATILSCNNQFRVPTLCTNNQTITFLSLPDKMTIDAPFTVTATASSGLDVSFSILSGPASISGSTITLNSNRGTVVVRAIQRGTLTLNAARSIDQSFIVSSPTFTSVPTSLEMTVGDTLLVDVRTQIAAPLVYTISDSTIANLLGARLIALKAGNATVSVSQPATSTFQALPVVNIPLKIIDKPSVNFDIIGSTLVPIGVIMIYSQPSVAGFTYSWSFSGSGFVIVPGTENTPNLEIIFLSNATVGEIISIVRDKNQKIVSSKSMKINILSNEEAELVRNLSNIDCPVEVIDCKDAYITSVKIGKLLNENSGCSRAGFGDFRFGRKLDTLYMGDSYDLQITSVAQAGKSSFFAIWLDYNNNGKFTDQVDFVAASFENSPSFEIKNLIIENKDAYVGIRTLRISMRADAAISRTDPCAKSGGSGETEDYAVFISKPDNLEAPNFISPNQDGKNDFFIIRGVNPKLPNKLMIMDRFGTIIYQKENYKNDWEANNGDSNVQDGTYYYLFTNGDKLLKGFIEVRRK